MYCKHCGKSIDEDSTFCRYCGKPQRVISFTETLFEEPTLTKGMANGHEWVDLGLSVKWATSNIGAKEPTDKGLYFAWGETEAKDFYSEDTYKLKSFWGGYKKIGNNIAGTKYDAAAVRWGGFWRMPTKEEMQELIESCTWEWTMINGVKGSLVSKDCNNIFLPYTQTMSGRGYLGNTSGSYWTGSLAEDNYTGCISYAWGLLFFGSDFQKLDNLSAQRTSGRLIRPVLDNKYQI